MVWELVPLNSSTGASKYFFTSQGTYKVGRKDCAVTIQTDKTISRVHAEITLEAASSWNSLQCFSNIPYPEIRLRDVSKFGTFINKETGSKPIFSLANRETMLKNGDVITFGTNNTTFRLSYVPFLFCIPPTENLKPKHFIQKTVSSIGAYATEKWRAECTHLIVEDSSPITNDVMDAIVAKKPIVLCDWLQVMVGQTCSFAEIPSCASFAPTLILKPGQASIPVKIADSMLRETCFHGFTFVVGPLHLYHYKERLQLLLEVAGATVVPVAKRCSSTQKTAISGNSFNDLIPFAKDPYKESDYGREMAEYVREEKKRKEAEALAEDLFNAERIKRQRGTAGASILETHSQRFHRQKVR
eukprot:Gb_19226 [translate_table: standard]